MISVALCPLGSTAAVRTRSTIMPI